MTWPGWPTLWILAVCFGPSLAVRLWRGRALPPPGPEQDPRIEALADVTAERMRAVPGVTVHRCGCMTCPRCAEHAQWAREMHELMRSDPE
jgi:hypothetical protein